jgi:6,7-dimethyl-8-ribityllumazine synthase
MKMPKIIEGNFSAKDSKIGIVISRFNEMISTRLLNGALDCLERHEADKEKIEIYYVPGAFEIPVVAKRLANTKKFDAIICLGAVIRGNTPHFDYIASEVAKGTAHVSLEFSIPVIFGVLTTDTIEQAIERAGTKSGNKGWDAALAAIEMINLFKQI